MNSFTRYCYRIGLACGLVAIVCVLIMISLDLGAPLPQTIRMMAEWAITIFGWIFGVLGIVLLVAAIVWLRKTWPHLSKATKVVSVLGLFMSTVVGAYVFHWLFPEVLNDRAKGKS